MSILHAVKWSFLSELASKAVAPLVFVILARLLTPEDYGVATAAAIVISFSQVFWDTGLGKAIVQYTGDTVTAATAAFWMNCAMAVVVALLLVALSGTVADRVFHDPRVATVLKVMSIHVVLGAAASVHNALLQKDMQFKRLFWVRLATVGAPAFLSIPLAATGFGYWALVAGTLVGQAAQVLVLWRVSPWRPSIAFDVAVARRLLRFGAWVVASGLLAWFYVWADALVVSIYLGARDLGLYRTGNMSVVALYTVLFGPLLPVLYSHFSQIQGDRERVRGILLKAVRVVTFVAVPTAFVVYAFSDQIGVMVFGSRWGGIGLVIGVMALSHGYSWTVSMNGEAYRAIGRPDYETKIMGIGMVVYVIGYFVSIRHGLEVFLWTRFGLVLLAVGSHLWVARIAVGFPVLRTLLHLLKVSVVGIPLVLIGNSVQGLDEGPLQEILLVIPLLVVCAVGYLWFIERGSLIPEFIGIVTRGTRAAASRWR